MLSERNAAGIPAEGKGTSEHMVQPLGGTLAPVNGTLTLLLAATNRSSFGRKDVSLI